MTALPQKWLRSIASGLLSRGPLAIGLAALGACSLALVLIFWFGRGAWPGDSFTYYLAGQRLNTGGQIYDLRPTDFFYAPGSPLYGPPLIAVIWRPLAALPGLWGVGLWLCLMGVAALWAVSLTLLELPLIGGLFTLALSLSLGLLIGVGNVDSFVLLALIWAWRWRDRSTLVGLTIGALVTLKLTPAMLIFWLIGSRRWRALASAAVVAAVLLAFTSAFANDPGIAFRYIAVMEGGLASGFPWARVTIVIGSVAVLTVSRRWPGLGFSLAIVAIPIASPVTAIHTFAILLAALAPLMGRRMSPETRVKSEAAAF